jgi:hypothetical protein
MDPTAFSLAFGILAPVLSYTCCGVGWAFSLPIGFGTTGAHWLGQRIVMFRTRRQCKLGPFKHLDFRNQI